MATLKSFVGFTYDNEHTSTFHLYRVSDGSRYNDTLSGTIKNESADRPAHDGEFYFGSNYKQKVFNLSLAFDDVTDRQLRDIRLWLNRREIAELIFDERPYVAYDVVLNGAPQIKYIPFGGEGGRIYKGEMTISFVCFYPFGHSPLNHNGGYKMVSQDYGDEYNNKDEWMPSSLLTEPDAGWANNQGNNIGEVKAPFVATIPANTSRVDVGGAVLTLIPFNETLYWNSKTGLITDDINGIGNVRNNLVLTGNTLATLPLGKFTTSGISFLKYAYLYY